MTSRRIIVLLIIFLGLLAYVYFFEIQGAKRKQAKEESEELLINLDKKQVTRLSFLPDGIVIAKDSIQWKILSPIRTDAEETTVESILNVFSQLKKGRFVSDNPNDFKKFGLMPYQSALVIEQQGNSDTLFIGNTNLDNTNVFYRKNGSHQVYLVPIDLKTDVTKSLFDLRDKSVVSFDEDSVTEILLQYPDFTFHCIKVSAQQWLVTQPDSGLAKSGKITGLLYNIKDIKVIQFIDKPYKSDMFYGFDRPAVKAILKKGNLILANLVIGKKTGVNLYLKNNLTNTIFMVQTKVQDNMSVKTEEFLDKDN